MKLELTECTPGYWEFVRLLRTDPRNIPGFLQQRAITPAEQQEYMGLHWTEHWIALLDGEPVGYAGVIQGDIRVCVHPDHQRRGVGKFLIESLMAMYPNALAKIKPENRASQKLFESCGFRRAFVVYAR